MTVRAAARAERGSGTALGLAPVLVLLVALLSVAALGAAMQGRGRAQTAADLAAVAGAQHLQDDGPDAACALATRTTEANGAVLTHCRVDGQDLVVRVGVAVRVGPFGPRQAGAAARAGPAGDAPPGGVAPGASSPAAEGAGVVTSTKNG